MAPSTGHQLLPKVWRVARFAFEKATRAIKSKLPEPVEAPHLRYQPVYARISHRQPISRIAAIRQSQSRYFSTSRPSIRGAARAFRTSKVNAALGRLTARAPFSSPLRPNLTGGALCRTASGYAVGAGRVGGARFFSHSPSSAAQVVHNVSAGVRAFWLSGQKVRFDGIDKRTGATQYKVVSQFQDEAERMFQATPHFAPGSYIDFELSPTITAVGCVQALKKQPSSASEYEPTTLNTEGLMHLLSVDLARALKEFAAVLNDLNRLSTLGDLPITLHGKSTLRIQFPGYDAESVERLCAEVGVRRGIVQQDPDFDMVNGTEIALIFPFAPSHVASEEELFSVHGNNVKHQQQLLPEQLDWRDMMLPTSMTSISSVESLVHV
ncbi:hypothetical protein AJ80_00848 [Polytolypa hystricis UAMH7299]|uniref:Uncharacterized protein n=1 Tax=Polytolypa hystricis (strain UAMH7299) TaxID=1447883 RepID=A0A2B7Z1U4_POLH7|nr:hypothetical protein AJ80_00848 [Polytolypa hystricis UAMH7299]